MTINPPALMLDTPDAAEMLGISPRTLEDYRWRGTGPAFYKVGMRLVRYRVDDLTAFALKSKRQNTASDQMPQ